MKELAALLVLLFVISIHPNFCAGLQCKIGTFVHGRNNYTNDDLENNSTCRSADDKFCVAGTLGLPTFSSIAWFCADLYHESGCAEVVKEHIVKRVKVTNFDCKCNYGPEGEDFANENFEILPVPISNVFMCKKGEFDSEKYGRAYKKECNDEDQYCYMARCAKGDEHVRTVWDCSPNTDCSAISAKVEDALNYTVACKCLFGKANASLANENFTLPMVPTTNADKPTNTTAEANIGVRAKISVCSGVLLAIGHVLASVLPKLGVGGQLFNDL
uniref:Activin_recp domain-containing protein n=1 Tax=Globodera pallida TaxID=36090 RepID=A0A183BUC0_GLOPA